jgi:hypothetical protein
MDAGRIFQSFFMAGFECSSHRRPDGVRLDLLQSSGHADLALSDYQACARHGLRTIRDGLRWHLIEREPGVYDWSSWMPMLEAAGEAGVQVIWDLFHYGSPDHVDRGTADFADRFERFAAAAAEVHRRVTGAAMFSIPVNEISFLTWAVRTGYFPSAGPDQPGWFKRHLVRAALAAVRAIREADPACRFTWAEPLIHVTTKFGTDEENRAAEGARQAQFEALDLLLGRAEPELGGSPDCADGIGLNFYPDNQWYDGGSTIPLGHHDYRPLAHILVETFERYGKPLFLAETGSEGSARPAWLHYVAGEVRDAMRRGVPIEGVCIYPIASFPGWDDFRHTDVGLFSRPSSSGERQVYEPLAEELRRQRALFGPRS